MQRESENHCSVRHVGALAKMPLRRVSPSSLIVNNDTALLVFRAVFARLNFKKMSSQDTETQPKDLKSDSDETKSDGITWDEFYDDPKADLILVSSDNVGFRVDARAFARKR